MVNLAAGIFCGGAAILSAHVGHAWQAMLNGFFCGMNLMIVTDYLIDGAKSHGRGGM